MTLSELRIFLTDTMSMSEVYQPVIIKELLENGGSCSKDQLAARLADHDTSVQEYYQKILMRWPKTTLTKHGVVEYDQASKSFVQLSTVSSWVCGARSFELPSVVRKPSRMHKSRFTRRVERLLWRAREELFGPLALISRGLSPSLIPMASPARVKLPSSVVRTSMDQNRKAPMAGAIGAF